MGRQTGSHERWKHEDGRATTIPIHGGRQIGPPLFYRILEQLGIDEKTFDLTGCGSLRRYVGRPHRHTTRGQDQARLGETSPDVAKLGQNHQFQTCNVVVKSNEC